MFLFVLVNSVI